MFTASKTKDPQHFGSGGQHAILPRLLSQRAGAPRAGKDRSKARRLEQQARDREFLPQWYPIVQDVFLVTVGLVVVLFVADVADVEDVADIEDVADVEVIVVVVVVVVVAVVAVVAIVVVVAVVVTVAAVVWKSRLPKFRI